MHLALVSEGSRRPDEAFLEVDPHGAPAPSPPIPDAPGAAQRQPDPWLERVEHGAPDGAIRARKKVRAEDRAPQSSTADATSVLVVAALQADHPLAAALWPDVKPGDLRILSIVEMWEKTPNQKEAARLYPIACSGMDKAEMLVVRETFAAPADASVDRMLYVVGGEATLTVNGRDQIVTNGWYAMIPRGTAHAWTRRGRNPVVILSTTGGQPCAAK